MNDRSLHTSSYLVTRWLWDTAEAGAAHLRQRGPIAQRLVHRVNNAIICLYTRQNKETHVQFYSWHCADTHTHMHKPLLLIHRPVRPWGDWRPQSWWLVILRLQLFGGGEKSRPGSPSLTLSSGSLSDHTQCFGGEQRRAEVPLESSCLTGRQRQWREERRGRRGEGGRDVTPGGKWQRADLIYWCKTIPVWLYLGHRTEHALKAEHLNTCRLDMSARLW